MWFRNNAPWKPTPLKIVKRMLELANVENTDIVYDLGSGDGRILIITVKKFKAKAVGIEISIFRYFLIQFIVTVLRLRKHVKVIHGDLFLQDLSEASVVTCYLLQRMNNQLIEKFKKELKPGTRIVSYCFSFTGLELVSKDVDEEIFVYKI